MARPGIEPEPLAQQPGALPIGLTIIRILISILLCVSAAAKCTKILDLCLILDSSVMTGLLNYEKLKSFLKRLTYAFDVSTDGVHIGAIIYSDHARVEIKLGDQNYASGLRAALGDNPYLGKIARIDRALRAASDRFFAAGNGVRHGARKVVVLFTSGHQTRTFDSLPLRFAAAPLRKKKVRTFVAAIGALAHLKGRLREVVESNDDILSVSSFNLLSEVSVNLVAKICGNDTSLL